MFGFKFPYTNFHALNLDWIMEKIAKAIYTINGVSPDANGDFHLDASLFEAVAKVNNISPDENGNVTITAEDVGAIPDSTDVVLSVNTVTPDENGNVTVTPADVGAMPADAAVVKKVNSIVPDSAGNVNVGTVKSVNNQTPDSAGNVNLPTVAGVTSVNGVGADGSGNVSITARDIPFSSGSTHTLDELVDGLTTPSADGVASAGSGYEAALANHVHPANVDSVNPTMDGVADPGTSLIYARRDHVHPSDTSKLSYSDLVLNTSVPVTVDISNMPATTSLYRSSLYIRTNANKTIGKIYGFMILIMPGTVTTGRYTISLGGTVKSPTPEQDYTIQTGFVPMITNHAGGNQTVSIATADANIQTSIIIKAHTENDPEGEGEVTLSIYLRSDSAGKRLHLFMPASLYIFSGFEDA